MSSLPSNSPPVKRPNWAANIEILQNAGYRLRFGYGSIIYVDTFPVTTEVFETCDPDELLALIEDKIGQPRDMTSIEWIERVSSYQAAGDMVRARNITDFMAAAKAAGCDLTVEPEQLDNIQNFIETMAGYGCPVTVEKIKMGGAE